MRSIAPMLLTWWVLPTGFPPGVWRRTLPRWRRILPRLGFRLPGFFLPGVAGPSSLAPLWYLHNIVRFEGFVCPPRSQEHTSELQSRFELVCRLLLVKNK